MQIAFCAAIGPAAERPAGGSCRVGGKRCDGPARVVRSMCSSPRVTRAPGESSYIRLLPCAMGCPVRRMLGALPQWNKDGGAGTCVMSGMTIGRSGKAARDGGGRAGHRQGQYRRRVGSGPAADPAFARTEAVRWRRNDASPSPGYPAAVSGAGAAVRPSPGTGAAPACRSSRATVSSSRRSLAGLSRAAVKASRASMSCGRCGGSAE